MAKPLVGEKEAAEVMNDYYINMAANLLYSVLENIGVPPMKNLNSSREKKSVNLMHSTGCSQV